MYISVCLKNHMLYVSLYPKIKNARIPIAPVGSAPLEQGS